MPWPHDLHHCTIGSLATPSSSSPFAFPASQGAPGYAALRVRCVARFIGETSPATQKLVATLLRHPMALFPDKSALLARVNGTRVRALVRLCCFAPSKLRSPKIQGWQTRRAVALSSHRTSRGPIGRHGCYIDSTHFTSNTRQHHHGCASPLRRPTEH